MAIRKCGLFLFLVAAGVVVGATFSCSSKSCLDEPNPDTACCAPLGFDPKTGACQAAGGDAAQDGPSGDGPVEAPSDCNEKADPKGEPKCVANGFAIFVSAAGNDADAGTKEKPLQTIGAALAKGKARVYVCEGTYGEHVKVTRGISLVGGFACSGWTYSGTKAKVAPADAGFALELANADGVTVSDLSFEASPGTAARRSSIAAFAHGAKGRLLRVELSAHEGKDGGASATAGTNYDVALLADDVKLAGQTAAGTVGGTSQDCPGLCTNNDHSTGGKGGMGTNAPTAGDPGKPDRGAGLGGLPNVCNASLENGNPGAPGDDGVAAKAVGALTEQGWSPSDGVAGKAGGPGQGGGGGGGGISGANGAGGGGGCGGCGGAPGNLAEGGGASIALLSLSSTLTLTNATLTTAKAGAGVDGTSGQSGQVGGAGGNQTSGGCQGGKGGVGAAGGASAGGAGGVSAGVVSKGGKPTLESPTTTTGDKGSKGAGGKPGTNDGPDGQKADSIDLP